MTSKKTAVRKDSILDVVILGAGFGGLCMAIKLLESGNQNFIILEKMSADFLLIPQLVADDSTMQQLYKELHPKLVEKIAFLQRVIDETQRGGRHVRLTRLNVIMACWQSDPSRVIEMPARCLLPSARGSRWR